jgi:hypothetical protein
MIQIKILHSKILEGGQDDRGTQEDKSRFLIFSTEESVKEEDGFESIHSGLFLI